MMTTPSPQRPAPKVGLVVNSIGVFDPAAKDLSEKTIRRHCELLVRSGRMAPQSMVSERIFSPPEALAVADRFAAAQVDLLKDLGSENDDEPAR